MSYKWPVIALSIFIVGFVFFIGIGTDPESVDNDADMTQTAGQQNTTPQYSPFTVAEDEPPVTEEPPEVKTVELVVGDTNKRPTVNAGDDFGIEEYELVLLEGFGKAYDGSQVDYAWFTADEFKYKSKGWRYNPRLASDNDIIIDHKNTANAKFRAPKVYSPRLVDLYLVVTDKQGNWASDSVNITINPIELPNMAFHDFDLPDKALKNCLAKHINLKNMLFAHEVKKLDCKSHDIEDLTGIEYLTNLQELSLVDNKIDDISKLEKLIQLRQLNLNRNKLTDIRPLAGLTQLFILYLGDNDIKNLEPLAKLDKLTYLRMDNNNISDIRPLSNLVRITGLTLSGNYIDNLNPLSDLTQLRVLEIRNNPFKRIDALLTHPTLRRLDIKQATNVRCLLLDQLESRPMVMVKREGECRL